jgi:hypothetical protein
MSQAGSTTGWHGEIRHAEVSDAKRVAALAAEFAHSFEFCAEKFHANYPALLASDGACLLLA